MALMYEMSGTSIVDSGFGYPIRVPHYNMTASCCHMTVYAKSPNYWDNLLVYQCGPESDEPKEKPLSEWDFYRPSFTQGGKRINQWSGVHIRRRRY